MKSNIRAYTMMVVLVLGIVLAALSAILLVVTGADRREAKLQQNAAAAVYGAEGAVAVGVETLRAALEQSRTPNLATVEGDTTASATAGMPNVAFDRIQVAYFDAPTNQTTTTVPPTTGLSTIASGPNAGLQAAKTDIQVLATARVGKSVASVADAIELQLIPIFQFAVFFDGDLETQIPAAMTVVGRVHTNGDLWLSNGSLVEFSDKVTAAKSIHNRSSFDSGTSVGSGLTTFIRTRGGTPRAIQTVATGLLPLATDALQKAHLEANFGIGDDNMLGDKSLGVQKLSVPIKITSNAACTTTCVGDKTCVKAQPTDATGVCLDNIVSRPSICATGGATAKFAQSLAIELIKRPTGAYDGDLAVSKPYSNGVGPTDVYTADYGPRPLIIKDGTAPGTIAAYKTTPGNREINDLFEMEVPRSIPILNFDVSSDDPGARLDRLWWKADIRIVDGIWYKRGSSVPIFNPENVDYSATNPSPTDLNHQIARVIRYSWWWDARESRTYCTGGGANCVNDANIFQRGGQIRSADFDASAFMSLLANPAFTALAFGGSVPADGVVVYMSETYDPVFEDANSKLPRAANVRNFLDFPTMHNHFTTAQINARARTLPRLNETGVGPAPRTPYDLGWFPENIWGKNVATANFRSLTEPLKDAATIAGTDAERAAAYAAPLKNPNAGFSCQDMSSVAAARQPATRPADFTLPPIKEPCIQAGATPLGAENAVRIIRAQSLPTQGFTFVTDNRLYLHGDVNVAADKTTEVVAGTTVTTNQDVDGRIAFIADSLTILSDKFDDRDRQGGVFQGFFQAPDDALLGNFTTATDKYTPWAAASTTGGPPDLCTLGNTTPVATRINASLLMGEVPACIDAGSASGNRSGGINNFPRFAENWNNGTSVTSVINGSMVSLFRSERGNSRFMGSGYSGTLLTAREATGYPANVCVYVPPDRRWTFDSELLTGIDKLPPGTPRVVATDRKRWVRR